MRVALRERAGRDGDDWSSALVKKWANIFDGIDSRLRLRGVIDGIDTAQMLGGQSRRGVFDEHERGFPAGSRILAEHDFGAGVEIDQPGGKRRCDGSESERTFRVFFRVGLIPVTRQKCKDRRQVRGIAAGTR